MSLLLVVDSMLLGDSFVMNWLVEDRFVDRFVVDWLMMDRLVMNRLVMHIKMGTLDLCTRLFVVRGVLSVVRHLMLHS